jgi:hypothetical protein
MGVAWFCAVTHHLQSLIRMEAALQYLLTAFDGREFKESAA